MYHQSIKSQTLVFVWWRFLWPNNKKQNDLMNFSAAFFWKKVYVHSHHHQLSKLIRKFLFLAVVIMFVFVYIWLCNVKDLQNCYHHHHIRCDDITWMFFSSSSSSLSIFERKSFHHLIIFFFFVYIHMMNTRPDKVVVYFMIKTT